jgi:Tol biopolymer transport system component/DNA-binding winged helix-turn-helix (wHTH) protein
MDQRRVRFGIFEVDLKAGELRRSGMRVHLQEQPLRILEMLLERHGEVVSRDEIKQALWPGDEFGEFDHAINVAIKKLREALGDNADNPLFVETMARRGYRFIAPMTDLASVSGNGEPATAALPAMMPAEKHTPRSRLFWVSAAVVLILVATIAGLERWFRPSASSVYQPQEFTTMQGVARKPAFSPDGNEIAFSWADLQNPQSRIYVQALGASTARKLIDDPEPTHEELLPKWWPDGTRIAYIRYLPNESDEIWTVPRTGGAPSKLLSLKQVLGFAIAPDSQSIAIAESGGTEQSFSIFIVSLRDGSRRALLPSSQAVPSGMGAYRTGDMAPEFSPDGRSIAFVRWGSSGADLYQVPAIGGNPQRLTKQNVRNIDGYAWVPDGQSLIVSLRQSATTVLALWRVWLRGERWEPLGVTSSRTSDPAVSADGHRLAFAQNTQASTNIYRYELAGSGLVRRVEPRNITYATCCDRYPAWSPDGSKIAFQSTRSGHYEIYVANSDGSNPVQITSFAAKLAGSPRWSPDGKQIAFDYRPDDHSHIFLVDATGGAARQITFDSTNDMRPQFSDDGQWVYFGRTKPGGTDIWKVATKGGEPVFVAADSISGRIIGNDLYFSKLFKPGVYSRRLSGGDERLLIPESDGVEFDIRQDGIYFSREPEGDHTHFDVSGTTSVNGRDPDLRRCRSREMFYYDFARGRAKPVLQTQVPICYGVAASPDHKWLLVSGISSPQSRIMLVPNF